MKTNPITVLVFLFVTISKAYSQSPASSGEMDRILKAYRESIHTAQHYQTCGESYTGPLYLMKRTENYSLDRMNILNAQEQFEIGLAGYNQLKPYFATNSRYLSMVRNMVALLVSKSSRPDLKFTVNIVQSDQINAFSTLGGYIYVYTGLLTFVDSKDELACVLAHEINHIILNHVVRKVKKIVLITAAGRKLNQEKMTAVAKNLNTVMSAPFDQIDEYEADRGGLTLIQKSGYDPNAFITVLTKMMRFDSPGKLAKFTSNHPASADRVKCLNSLLGK